MSGSFSASLTAAPQRIIFLDRARPARRGEPLLFDDVGVVTDLGRRA